MKSPPIEFGPEQGRKAMIFAFGVQCAAWLVGTNRRRLRRHVEKALRFRLPPNTELPAWFEIAFCYLRDFRSSKWEVSKRITRGSGVDYVIRWRGRPKPAALFLVSG